MQGFTRANRPAPTRFRQAFADMGASMGVPGAGGDDTASVDLSPLNGSAPYAIAYAFENQKDTCCNAGADPGEHGPLGSAASLAGLSCHTDGAVLQTSPMVSSSARRPPALSSCRTLALRSARCRRTLSSRRSRVGSVSASSRKCAARPCDPEGYGKAAQYMSPGTGQRSGARM